MTEQLSLKRAKTNRWRIYLGFVLSVLVLNSAVRRWLLDPYDFGERVTKLEHYLTNQQISVVWFLFAAFLAFVAWWMRKRDRMPEHWLLTPQEFKSLEAKRTIPWSDVASAIEKRMPYLGDQLWLRSTDGKYLYFFPLNGLNRSRAEIIAFIRKIRPDMPIELRGAATA